MPNFENFPSSAPVPENDTKKDKEGILDKVKKTGRKVAMVGALTAASLGAINQGHAESPENFNDKKDKTEQMNKIPGTLLEGVEAEDEDLEIRTYSLNELGSSPEELGESFQEYYKKHKNKFSGTSTFGNKERKEWTEAYLQFLNEKFRDKIGGNSYVMTEKENEQITQLYRKRAEQMPQRKQVYIAQEKNVGGETTTFRQNYSERGKTGKIEITTTASNTPGIDNNMEFIFKIEK